MSEDSAEVKVSPLQGIGFTLIAIGALPLIGIAIMFPDAIILREAGPLGAGVASSYEAQQEFMLLSWAFYLCPVIIIWGAIFAGAGAIATSVSRKFEGYDKG